MDISLSPEILFYIGFFPVTNSFLSMLALSAGLVLFSLIGVKRLKDVPSKIQSVAELVFEGSWNFALSTIGDEKKTRKIFPYVFTIFIFVLLANLLTLIPGQSAVSYQSAGGAVPFFRAIMADYGLVFIMTITSVIMMQIITIAAVGPLGYAGKFINIKNLAGFFVNLFKGKLKFGMLAQGCLDVFLGFMDLIGELAKVFSLSFRLFGNVFAGEVLGAVMLFLLPFFGPVPFLFLGLLSSCVQAFVFAVLTLVFVNMASEAGMQSE
ncbi:MAG: FoF1 ATP synthase subunit a [Patescibacteria group bacterium]|jgi:F-type H+-transporting ATPase subunit a